MTGPRVHVPPTLDRKKIRKAVLHYPIPQTQEDLVDLAADFGGLPMASTRAVKIGGTALAALAERLPAAVRKGIEAWHGSPHKFDKFSLDKIGTGEGAQAFGHGLYFAESRPVAESYRAVAEPSYRNAGVQAIVRDEIEAARRLGISEPEARKVARASIHEQAMERGPHLRQQWFDALNNLDDILDKPSGSLYRAKLDVDPDELLDWDVPLREQPNVWDKLRGDRMGLTPRQVSKYHAWVDEADRPVGNMSTGGAPDRLLDGSNTGPSVLRGLSGDRSEAASQLLDRAGVKGIRYLDGGSRTAGEGTRNYVIFDPERIKILERLAVAGTLGPAGMAELEQLKQAQRAEDNMAAPMGPQSPQRINPADLWEQKVNEGMSEDEATAFVEQAMRGDDAPDFSNVESESASRAVEPENPMLGAYKSAGRLLGKAAQGATFGFGDEIAGAAGGAASAITGDGFASGYKRNRDRMREQMAQSSRDNPKLSAAAELAGAVVSPLAKAMAVPKGLGLARQSLAASKAGAAGGALYGAGNADGDIGDRIGGGLAGGAIGGAAGAATPALVQLAKAMGRIPGSVKRSFTGSAATASAPAKSSQSATDKAREYVVQALERDRVALDPAATFTPDDPRMLYNLGGRSSGMATRVSQAIPSEATDAVPRAINAQLEGGPQRVLRALESATGKPIPNPRVRLEELANDAAKAAKPHYAAIENEFVDSPALRALRQRPDIEAAMAVVERGFRNRGQAIPDGMTVGGLNRVKKILDGDILKIEKLVDEGKASGAQREALFDLQQLRDELVGALDEATLVNPLDPTSGSRYAQARRVAEEGIGKREAFREGTKYATARGDRLEADIPGMTPENQAAYREGAATAIEDVVSRTPDRRNLAARLFGSNAEREKLQTAFQGDPVGLKKIQDAFQREDQLRQQATAALAPGQSMTTPLKEAVEEFRGTMLEDIARSGLWSAAKRRALEAYFRSRTGLTEEAANEVGRLMTSRPNQALMQMLLQARGDALSRSGRSAVRGGRVGIGTAAGANQLTRP